MIGEDKLIHFSGVEMGSACTIVLRGASERLPLGPNSLRSATRHNTDSCSPVQLS